MRRPTLLINPGSKKVLVECTREEYRDIEGDVSFESIGYPISDELLPPYLLIDPWQCFSPPPAYSPSL